MFRAIGVFAILAVGLLSASSAGAADFPVCRNGLFPENDRDGFREGVIKVGTGTQVHFYDDANGCLAGDVEKCALSSYVVPGDHLVVAYIQDGWVCGFYRKSNFGSSHAGWLPASAVTLLPTKAVTKNSQWIGKWSTSGLTITIEKAEDGRLHVHGDGHWHVQGFDDRYGNFEGTARPKGNRMIIKDEPCLVSMEMLNGRLLAKDNRACGATNVRFDDVFDHD